VQEVGIESAIRDSSAAQKPPMSRLHVWWARRPHTTCRAAILASLLPPDVPHKWFLKTLGILGDPVAAHRRMTRAKAGLEKLTTNPFDYPRAFTYTPDDRALGELFDRVCKHWDSKEIRVLDPMAGGGSIPGPKRSPATRGA